MASKNNSGRVEIMGVPIDPLTMEETVSRATKYIQDNQFAHFIGVNADKLLQMQDDPTMDEIVRRCEVINADGASMLIAANRLGVDLPERVAGVDLMLELCETASLYGYSVYLLGAKREVVEQTKAVLLSSFPNLQIVGIHDGYFDQDAYSYILDLVKKANPQIIFVGITSPKKEELIEYFRQNSMKGIFVGVGGSFDVISGNIKRSPKWMQRIKLEWLYRMIQEPRRLAKRYIIGNVRFLRLLRQDEKEYKGKHND